MQIIFSPTIRLLATFLLISQSELLGFLLEDTQTYDLVHQEQEGETLNIRSQVQYFGSVIVDSAGQEENVRVLPLDVRARFDFDQRISSGSIKTPQAIRYFETAKAVIKAGKGRTESNLQKENQIVLSRFKNSNLGQSEFQIASIAGKLRQKEYELLKNPGDPLTYSDLFQKQNVKVGQKWKLKKEQVVDWLALNRVIQSSMTMMLKSVDDDVAKVYLFGKVKGEVDDAITDLKVKGIAQFDLNSNRVVNLRLSIDEERRPGHVAPGFEGKIKLDTRLAKTTENILISKKRLSEAFKGKKVKFSFLFDRDDNEFQLIHGTDWRVIASEEEAAVFRLLDDGQLIAQCNVVQLPDRPADQPMKLSQFQQEISRITKDTESRIIDSDKSLTDSGLETLRVAVEGMESDIPFLWLYYHIANKDGRRVTLVFTLEKEALDYFANADRELVKSVSFKPTEVSTASKRKTTTTSR